MKGQFLKITTVFLIIVGIVFWGFNYIFLNQNGPKSKATGETMYLTFSNAGNVAAQEGSDFTVNLIVKPSINTVLRGYHSKISFDKTKLQFKSIQYKTGVVSTDLGHTDAKKDEINLKGNIYLVAEDQTASGFVLGTANGAELAAITFTVLDDASNDVTASESEFFTINSDNTLSNSWTVASQFLHVNMTISPTPTGAATSSSGIIVPLYTYPGSTWTRMIDAKNANPSVNMIAIVNPNNGPGASVDPNYTSGINNLRSAGIKVLGYTYTGYGKKDPKPDIDKWKSFYTLDGIFFDEMSNDTGKETFYSNLNQYTKSKGYTLSVGNPGTDVQASFVGTVDIIMIYESAGLPSLTQLGGWHSNHNKNNWSIIPYAVNSLDNSYIQSAKNLVGYIYVTNDNLTNPWDSLPPYFEQLVGMLAGTSTAATPTPVMCGGIAGLICPEGSQCIYSDGGKKAPFPDASGVCQTHVTGCKGVQDGTVCKQCQPCLKGAVCPAVCIEQIGRCQSGICVPTAPTATPTPTPISVTGNTRLDMKLKYQGIAKKPATNSMVVKVQVSGGALTAPVNRTGTFTANDSGVWTGAIGFDATASTAKYTVYVKGPKHLQKKICDISPSETAAGIYRCGNGNITLTAGNNTLDFSKILLLSGDIYGPDKKQDGLVSSIDVSFIKNNLSKTETAIIAVCDINLDGKCDTQDYSLVINALSIKTDEQ